MQQQNQWFIPGEGIAREVITADIQRYLGPDALVRPGVGTVNDQKHPGYWITAYRTLTSQMIEDLKLDSKRWKQEYLNGREVAYEKSQTHASRQHWGPSQSYDHGNSSQFADRKDPEVTRPGHMQGGFGAPYTDSSSTLSQYASSEQAAPGYYIASDGRQYPLVQHPRQPQFETRTPYSRRAPPSDISSNRKSKYGYPYGREITQPLSYGDQIYPASSGSEPFYGVPILERYSTQTAPPKAEYTDPEKRRDVAPAAPIRARSSGIVDHASKAGLGLSAAAGVIGIAALGRSALFAPSGPSDEKPGSGVGKTTKKETDSAPKPSVKPTATEIPRPHSGGGFRRGFFN